MHRFRLKFMVFKLIPGYFKRFHAILQAFPGPISTCRRFLGPFLFLIFWGQDILKRKSNKITRNNKNITNLWIKCEKNEEIINKMEEMLEKLRKTRTNGAFSLF